jgi:uncharacterized coiled-coil protein SlyX
MVHMPDGERKPPPPITAQNEAIVEQLRQKFRPLVDRLRPEMESAATFDVAAQSTLPPFPKPR